MPELLTDHGLVSLFLLSLCASTLIPLGSEWLLVALLLQGTDATAAVLVATAGNSLGGASSYLIGRLGSNWLAARVLRISSARRQRAENLFLQYGSWSLFFSWLPVIGDPLCLVGGLLKVHFGRFCLLVAGGKGLRYLVVALLTLQGAALAS
ncbi:MAG: YqaA family protein [Desulfuromonadales bacterium]|jgi:membrane protein YqaA with SNARE-associated domain|nr:YqaA family protein [Desulfuromonadales bacterium]